MIIQLKIFVEDEYGRKKKIFPDLFVDHELLRYEYFDLQGIIWHHGEDYDEGHYTSSVKVNEVWYQTNDTLITQNEMFQTVNDQVPYIVVYKKRNAALTNIVFQLTTTWLYQYPKHHFIQQVPQLIQMIIMI
jgi:hypothetical protein